MNITKEFIPYEESLDLKELGFDEPCIAFYEPNNKEVMVVGVPQRYNDPSLLRLKDFCAPLFQQVFRWFRETFGIDSHIKRDYSLREMPKQYCYTIESEDGFEESKNFNTYEEAELACLKKLIEIVQTH
jgi:hypothetical protein